MTNDQIENFLSKKHLNESQVRISFKNRNPVVGLFIQTGDYIELKSKNLWRIVSETNIEEYKKTKDTNLARIFNGIDFTRLGLL